jgi:FkbM family methyltransferase
VKATVKQFLYRPFKQLFNTAGFDIVAKGKARNWRDRLEQAKDLGFRPQTILDGGAFRGLWSKNVATLFPGAQIILVEPNPFLQEIIKGNIADIRPMPKILKVALGESPGKAPFNIWQDPESDQSASLLTHVSGKANRIVEVEVDTIDNIADRFSFAPDLIKLDLQGGELAALKGAKKALQHAELVIAEFGCLEAYIERTTPRELLDVMYEHDYCLYDIVDCHDRRYDGALTGGDFFFVKNSSSLRSYKGWE